MARRKVHSDFLCICICIINLLSTFYVGEGCVLVFSGRISLFTSFIIITFGLVLIFLRAACEHDGDTKFMKRTCE